MTNGSIAGAVHVSSKGPIAESIVGISVDVVRQRKSADGSALLRTVIEEKRSGPDRCVIRTGGVEQHRSKANCGIAVRGVKRQRSSANASIEVAGRNAAEGKPADSCVGSAAGQAQKSLLPFSRGKVGITAVWWRNNR